MKFKYILFVLNIVPIISCQYDKEHQENILEFKIPEIVNTQFPDSILSKPFKSDYVSEVFPTFIGKFEFQNKVDINPKYRDTIIPTEYLEEYSEIRIGDSLDANGFELIVDYDKTVKYNRYYDTDSILFDHYPVFFVNSSNSDKIFLAKDSYVFGIQEALDTLNWPQWRPIEGRGFDFCGNGKWGLIVHPNEFILVLMRKYEGNFKTGIRARFQIGENIYVSKPFKGTINSNQFNIKDDSSLKSYLQKSHGRAATWLFYGAEPHENKWAVITL